MIGSKGLPATYGGIERHIEEIGRRLAARGHDVTVFGRKPFSRDGTHLGMRIRVLPSIPTKNLDTATSSFAACMPSLSKDFDIVHFHGIGPSIFAWIPRLARKKTVATIHALDYRQRKWGAFARIMLKMGERSAVRNTNAAIAVSRLMTDQLSGKYSKKVHYIPNGANLRSAPDFRDSSSLDLKSGGYILTVGRFIVEREFHTLITAFSGIDTEMKLVIAGDERFEGEYARRLREIADPRVIFPGYVSGGKLDELYAHCRFYVLPSLVEGLPISLIEAMSFSKPVLISDIPENLEVAGGVARTFARGNRSDLARALKEMIELGEDEKTAMGKKGRKRVIGEYDWDRITDSTESLYLDLMPRVR